ncbi:MAG: patatin-like phospholipase family protein [Prevotella sp.]|nr:patatin-like phospholipase family protein [Prevotella sp.]
MRKIIIYARLLIILLLAATVTDGGAQTQTTRPKVGLVLGGGGAKGAAEVGVLKVIEELGIPIDYIAGTSIGAILGGLYATGYRAEQLDSLFRSGLWMTDNVLALLDRLTETDEWVDFDELPIPFRCVAVDFDTQEEVVFSNGNLASAMRASMAIPGVYKPVLRDGKTLVDGGMANNLPVDVVKAMGADIVIAVDLTQNKHKTREFSLKELTGIGGIFDWIVSRPDWKKYNENRAAADVYINPPLKGYNAASFSYKSIDEMIRIGEQTAHKHQAELQKVKRMVSEVP